MSLPSCDKRQKSKPGKRVEERTLTAITCRSANTCYISEPTRRGVLKRRTGQETLEPKFSVLAVPPVKGEELSLVCIKTQRAGIGAFLHKVEQTEVIVHFEFTGI